MSHRNEFYANLKLQPMEQAKQYREYQFDGSCYGYKPTKPMAWWKALLGITVVVLCAIVTGLMLAGIRVL